VNNSTPAPSDKAGILCVEDDRDTCELLGVLFPDYDVVFTHTVSEGLRMFESRKFDLCILDNWLPDGSGIELCKKIRALNETIPIVFASAAGFKADIQKALDAGAQEYLVKPYEPEKLLQIVKNLLEGK
jgi:DNA-binding response OmpR family regulator